MQLLLILFIHTVTIYICFLFFLICENSKVKTDEFLETLKINDSKTIYLPPQVRFRRAKIWAV